jgi:hypothetical protein
MNNATKPSRRIGHLLVDDGLAWILACLAAAGSFTHIRDLAIRSGQHGWMADAIAVCIDMMCVMAVRERKRDQRLGRHCGRLSWPTAVLTMGICLTIAANLATAQPTAWGWIVAATPAGTFLIAVSMLERRASLPDRPTDIRAVEPSADRHVDVRRTHPTDNNELPRPRTGPIEGATSSPDIRRDVKAIRPRHRPRSSDIEVRARAVRTKLEERNLPFRRARLPWRRHRF